MKKYLRSAFLFLTFFGLFFSTQIFAQEKIWNFDVVIKVNSDASVNVEEKILYDFGDRQAHGIYRNIPVNYIARGGNFNVKISDVSVTDGFGNRYTYTTGKEGKFIKIKIGDEDKLVVGKKLYIVNYKMERVINFFKNYDELYWNATGNEWDAPIDSATVTVILPQKINASDMKLECYAGLNTGINRCNENGFLPQKAQFTDTAYFRQSGLSFYQGLTVVVGFPSGIVVKPSVFEEFTRGLMDNSILLLPFALFIFLFGIWRKRGRDPKGKGVIIPQYDVPDGITPSEAGVIIDGSADNYDISADIINLAVKGYLKIFRTGGKAPFPKPDDYAFQKMKNFDDTLNGFEKYLLEKMFLSENTVSLSSLKSHFYKDMANIKNQVYESTVKKGYFVKNPQDVRNFYKLIGAIMVISGFWFGNVFNSLYWILSLAVSGFITIAFGYFMPHRTNKGVQIKEYILGLKSYLSVAEKDRLAFHNAPEKNPERFEKLLPYAMALRVEKQWAKQFEGIYNQSPEWYADSSGMRFNSLILANSLNSFTSTAGSTLTAPPASSGVSGFGGGGFSGGGFGGGGGGRW